MKRKIALLLAMVMALSVFSLLPVTVTAQQTQYSASSVASVSGKTLLFEAGIYSPPAQVIQAINNQDAEFPEVHSDRVQFYADGTDLVIYPGAPINPGMQIELTLENAHWFFRSDMRSVRVTDSWTVADPLWTTSNQGYTISETSPAAVKLAEITHAFRPN